MSRALRDRDIETLVKVLDGWSGDISWEQLSSRCEIEFGIRYTRQTLHRIVRIRNAFSAVKVRRREARTEIKERRSISHDIAESKITILEQRIERLESENNLLLEQYVRWQYNAVISGLTPEVLNRALPAQDLSQPSRKRISKN